MHKLTLLFHHPGDIDEFETRWSQEFVSTIEQMPGIRRVSVSRVLGAPLGDIDPYLAHEFYFESADALHAAMASPEGQQAGKTLMEIASGSVSMFMSEYFEQPHET